MSGRTARDEGRAPAQIYLLRSLHPLGSSAAAHRAAALQREIAVLRLGVWRVFRF